MNYEDKDRTIYLYDDGVGKVQLVQAMGTDATVVHAARVSFGKIIKTKNYLKEI